MRHYDIDILDDNGTIIETAHVGPQGLVDAIEHLQLGWGIAIVRLEDWPDER